MKVFVYGTLKKGMRLHYHLDGCRFLGTTSIQAKLYKFAYGPPFIMEGNGVVFGELYEVTEDKLEELDQAEGLPYDLYIRRFIMCDNGKKAWVYFVGDGTFKPILNGVFTG